MLPRLLFICLVLSSCSPHMMETDLYFGQSRPDGTMITEKEWSEFKENNIAGTFKEGSTIVPALGNWFDPDHHKLITEPTYVVIYFYKKSSAISRQVDTLREKYKVMFQQQSVLRVDKKVKARF